MPSFARLASVGAILKAVAPALRPGSPSLGERAGSVPRLVRATLNGEYTGLSKGRLALMLAATGYIVSPLDLIPEAVFPILGIADDAMVLSWLASRFVEETESFLEWERAKAGMPYAGTSGTVRCLGHVRSLGRPPARRARFRDLGAHRVRGGRPGPLRDADHPRRRRLLSHRRREGDAAPARRAPRPSTGGRGAPACPQEMRRSSRRTRRPGSVGS